MPKYEVFVKYEIEDCIIVEADNDEQAIDLAYDRETITALSENGYSLSWDNVDAYDVQEVED